MLASRPLSFDTVIMASREEQGQLPIGYDNGPVVDTTRYYDKDGPAEVAISTLIDGRVMRIGLVGPLTVYSVPNVGRIIEPDIEAAAEVIQATSWDLRGVDFMESVMFQLLANIEERLREGRSFEERGKVMSRILVGQPWAVTLLEKWGLGRFYEIAMLGQEESDTEESL